VTEHDEEKDRLQRWTFPLYVLLLSILLLVVVGDGGLEGSTRIRLLLALDAFGWGVALGWWIRGD
jgi:hypothetical protein